MFLQRRFRVIVNGKSVDPVKVEVLVSDSVDGPAPMFYETTIDGVTSS